LSELFSAELCVVFVDTVKSSLVWAVLTCKPRRVDWDSDFMCVFS